MSDQAPRRYKMRTEYSAEDRAAAARFGAKGRPERPEYVKWRTGLLRAEHDDLPLRERLLREQAEAIRSRAADQKTAALSQLTPADWDARGRAKAEGKETPLPDGGAAGLDADADKLDREAQEVAQFLAETTEAA
jgi:hypothetical protein